MAADEQPVGGAIADEASSRWLLSLLAGGAGDPAAAAVEARLRVTGLAPEAYTRLCEDLEDDLPSIVIADPPHALAELERWLDVVAKVELAGRSAARLDAAAFPWAPGLSALLQRMARECTAAVGHAAHVWMCARRAESERARWGEDVAPWRAIRPLAETGSFDAPNLDRELVLEAWSLGVLHDQDDAVLRGLVAAPSDWQDRYRQLLSRCLDEITLTRRDFDLSLEAEPIEAWVRLPHLGRDAGVEIRHTAAGVRLSWLGIAAETVAVEAGEHTLAGDAVTGPLTVKIDVYEPSLLEQMESAASTGGDIAVGLAGDRAETLALALARWLASDAPRKALRAAAVTFDEGRDATDDEQALVAACLELRVALDRIESWLGSEQLTAALAETDRTLSDVSQATFLLDDETYDDLTATVIPDSRAWWGAMRSLDESVPLHVVTRALADLPAEDLGRASQAGHAGGERARRRGRVIRIQRLRPAPPPEIELLAASFRPEDLDDPGVHGSIVESGIDGLELRVHELATEDESSEHSVVCLRLSLDESSGADFQEVSLRTPGGQPVLALRIHARPLLWWAIVRATGEIVIDLPDLQHQIVVDLGPAGK